MSSCPASCSTIGIATTLVLGVLGGVWAWYKWGGSSRSYTPTKRTNDSLKQCTTKRGKVDDTKLTKATCEAGGGTWALPSDGEDPSATSWMSNKLGDMWENTPYLLG